MGDNEVYITTTKQRSSMRQILAAIDHLHKQEFEAAITLAAAAEGQIAEGAIRHLFRIMRQKLPKADHNKVINWLKHPTGGPDSAQKSRPIDLFSGRTASCWRFRPRKTGICGWSTPGSDAAKVVLPG
jgi:hypothetical protein